MQEFAKRRGEAAAASIQVLAATLLLVKSSWTI